MVCSWLFMACIVSGPQSRCYYPSGSQGGPLAAPRFGSGKVFDYLGGSRCADAWYLRCSHGEQHRWDVGEAMASPSVAESA